MHASLVVIVALVAVQLAPGVASAQPRSFCRPGEVPQFTFGFAALKAELGPIMGEPIECAHPNSANGDVLQNTTTGLSFWRKATNTPTFTDGFRHWGLAPNGLVYWEGASVDPPGVVAAQPVPAPAPQPLPRPAPAPRTRAAAADYFPGDGEMPPRFVRVGADQVRLLATGEMVSRGYGRQDGSVMVLFSIRSESQVDAGLSCAAAVSAFTQQGFEVISDSQRGEGGVVIVGRVQGQPSSGVFFRYGVFCGGAIMAGPIIAAGTADPDAPQQLGHVLTIMESRAWAFPDGYR